MCVMENPDQRKNVVDAPMLMRPPWRVQEGYKRKGGRRVRRGGGDCKRTEGGPLSDLHECITWCAGPMNGAPLNPRRADGRLTWLPRGQGIRGTGAGTSPAISGCRIFKKNTTRWEDLKKIIVTEKIFGVKVRRVLGKPLLIPFIIMDCGITPPPPLVLHCVRPHHPLVAAAPRPEGPRGRRPRGWRRWGLRWDRPSGPTDGEPQTGKNETGGEPKWIQNRL